jgi:hypothetical protein
MINPMQMAARGSEDISEPVGLNNPMPQPFARGGVVVPTQIPVLRPSDRRYLEERQAEYDRYKADVEAYNAALNQYRADIYDPYVAQKNAYDAAVNQWNTEVYSPYQQQVNAYNAAIEAYNRDVYSPYQKAYTEYEQAANAWNQGPRTEDYAGPSEPTLSPFSMAAPTTPTAFGMAEPTLGEQFSRAVPTVPFKEEEVKAYQQKAAQRAGFDAEQRGLAIEVVNDPRQFNISGTSLSPLAFAKGGDVSSKEMLRRMKSQVARAGRNGDTELAHLGSSARGMLKSMGGAGTVNPDTGLREYFYAGELPPGALVTGPVAPGVYSNDFVGPIPAGSRREGDAAPAQAPAPSAEPIQAPAQAPIQAPAPSVTPSQERAPISVSPAPVPGGSSPSLAELQERLVFLKSRLDETPPTISMRSGPLSRPRTTGNPEYAALNNEYQTARQLFDQLQRQNPPQPQPQFRYLDPSMPSSGPVAITPGAAPATSGPTLPPSLSGPITPEGGMGAVQPPTPTPVAPQPMPPSGTGTPPPVFSLPPVQSPPVGQLPPSMQPPSVQPPPIPNMGQPGLVEQRPQERAEATSPANYFTQQPRTPGALPGTMPVTPPQSTYRGPRPTDVLAQNQNLTPGMLGGMQNAGVMTDRLGNLIYAPTIPLRTFAKGGEASTADFLRTVNEYNLYGDDPAYYSESRNMLNAMPVDETTYSETPSKIQVKRVRGQELEPKSAKGIGKGMAMELESLSASKDAKPEAMTGSAKADLLELARAYKLKAMQAEDTARGLMKDTLTEGTLDQPTLTRGSLTKKRFQEGGEVKKSSVESETGTSDPVLQQAELTLLLAKTGEPSISFGAAFQAARALSRDQFEWRGKPYRAQTAEEARGQSRLPRGMKESDLYRDPAQERINKDYYDATQAIEKNYQQSLRDISSDSGTRQKRDLQPYTSDMAPFEDNQRALKELDRHMGQMRQYEEDELIQGTVNEEVERQRERDRQEIAELMRRVNEMKADVSLMNIRDYEQAERDADAQLNAQRLRGMEREQAVKPVYPEMLLPGLPRAVRGAAAMLDRLRGGKRPPKERKEPTMNFQKGGEASKKPPSLFGVSDYATSAAAKMFPEQRGQDDQRDAARHMLAAAILARQYGPRTADLLGRAHEYTSSPHTFFSMFGIGEPRDDFAYDLHNNRMGIELASRAKSQEELEQLVAQMARQASTEKDPTKPWIMSREQMEARRIAMEKKMKDLQTRPESFAQGGPVNASTAKAQLAKLKAA